MDLIEYVAKFQSPGIRGVGLEVDSSVPKGIIGEIEAITPDGTPVFEWVPLSGLIAPVADRDAFGIFYYWYIFVPFNKSQNTWLCLHEPRFQKAFLEAVPLPPQWVLDELERRLQDLANQIHEPSLGNRG